MTVAERGVVVVQDLQVGVELLADAVADERPHDAERALASAWSSMARPMSESGRPGLHRLDAAHQALAGDPHQALRAVVDVADEERGVGVAVHAVEVDRDVEVDDVAVDQRAVVGDAVADDLVDRGAQRLAGSRCS